MVDPGHGGVHAGERAEWPIGSRRALKLALRVRRTLARTLPDPRVGLARENDRVAEPRSLDLANAVGRLDSLDASPPHRGGIATDVLDATHDAQALGLAVARK